MSSRITKDTIYDENTATQKKQTLDALHKQKIKSMHDIINSVPEKKEKCRELENKIEKIKEIGFHHMTDEQMNLLFGLEEELKTLKNEISESSEETLFVNYFINTSDVLYQYYDNMENISKGQDNGRKKKISSISTTQKPNSIIDFFNKKKDFTIQNTTTTLSSETKTSEEEKSLVEPVVEEDKNSKKYVSRQKLLDNYLTITDPQHLSETTEDIDQEICPLCGTERILYQNEALMTCPNKKCGTTHIVLMDSNKPSHKDPPREMSFYSYKRINHFNEWLAQFQAKETTDINEEVYNSILLELKKERLSNMAKLSPQKMKDILKRLGYNKYYEHIPHIINRLNGLPAPVMTRETEEKLRSMFKEIQAPFIKHCPVARKNFLSYSYVLHKLCQLLELDEFLHCFPMLKSREKLHQQDQIWEKICEELGWEFIKSI